MGRCGRLLLRLSRRFLIVQSWGLGRRLVIDIPLSYVVTRPLLSSLLSMTRPASFPVPYYCNGSSPCGEEGEPLLLLLVIGKMEGRRKSRISDTSPQQQGHNNHHPKKRVSGVGRGSRNGGGHGGQAVARANVLKTLLNTSAIQSTTTTNLALLPPTARLASDPLLRSKMTTLLTRWVGRYMLIAS